MKNIKRLIAVMLTVVMLATLLCSCSLADATTDQSTVEAVTDSEEAEEVEESIFVGEWICLKENSCNDMEIVLTISQENGELNLIRDMESDTDAGSMDTYNVEVPAESTFYSSDMEATYTLTDDVLIEDFGDNGTNYYSVTGEISEEFFEALEKAEEEKYQNTCAFYFCSEKCGDSKYCSKHDSESKRYQSITVADGRVICKYIEGRYEYYDDVEGGYSGDKYSDKIMQEAGNKYGISADHAFMVWSKYDLLF